MQHYDLYRLSSSAGDERDLLRLDLPRATRGAVCLFEWAERLQSQLPSEHLAVHISIIAGSEVHAGAGNDGRLPAQTSNSNSTVSDAGQGSRETEGGITGGGTEVQHEPWEDEDDEYTDRRARSVNLVPHGYRWQNRLESLELECRRSKNGLGQDDGLRLVSSSLDQEGK